jgi:hypothetical protein
MGLFTRKHEPVRPVIDLREEPAPPPKPRLEFGMPTPCPECGVYGYLDHIDPYRRVMFEHCPNCFTKWEISEQQLAEA